MENKLHDNISAVNDSKKTIEVVGAVIIQDGKLFTAQRNHGKYSGYWEFPGGKIETGESPEDALIREIKEELCAEINIDGHFARLSHDYEIFMVSLNLFLCHFVSEYKLIEHSEARWLDASSLLSVKWLPADLPVMDKIKAKLINK